MRIVKNIFSGRLKWVKRIAIIVLFFVAVSFMPDTETQPVDDIKIEQNEKDKKTDTEKIEKKDEAEAEEEKEVSEVESRASQETETTKPSGLAQAHVDLSSAPTYSGQSFVAINNNMPTFAEVSTQSFESYSSLDGLGRCGVAYACIGIDLMPTEERGSIGSVKPTGWHTVKYDIVDGKYLYNRCHLIGFQLSGENANAKNLITGTRYMNVDGMLPFENMVADYVKETENHVMYRVTPDFRGGNLLASGVQIEAYSVEDNGEGICFNVYVYNVQPGITINYANGDSSLTSTTSVPSSSSSNTSNSTGGSSNTGTTTGSTDSSTNTDSSNSTSVNTGSSALVWISATGKKYHAINNCGTMNPAKATQMTEAEAIGRGLGPCSKCY